MVGYFQPDAQVCCDRMDWTRQDTPVSTRPRLVLLLYFPASCPVAFLPTVLRTALVNLVVDSKSVMITADFCDSGQAHYSHLSDAPHQ